MVIIIFLDYSQRTGIRLPSFDSPDKCCPCDSKTTSYILVEPKFWFERSIMPLRWLRDWSIWHMRRAWKERGHLISVHKYFVPGGKEDTDSFFLVVARERRALCHWALSKSTENSTFTVRVVKQWKRLPTEVVVSPSLEIFKTLPGTARSNLLKFSLIWVGH